MVLQYVFIDVVQFYIFLNVSALLQDLKKLQWAVQMFQSPI